MGSSSSKPSGASRTVVSNNPPAFQQPYIERGLQEAETLFDTPRTFYEGSTVVPFNPNTQAGLDAMKARATAGSPLVTAAQTLTKNTMAGDYLSPDTNPYLKSAMDAATRPMTEAFTQDVMPSIDAAFSGGGRYGSGLQANQQARAAEDYLQALGDAGSKMAYSNYADERGRQMTAAAAAPAMAELDYLDPSRLIDIGAAYEGMAERELREDIDRHRFAEDEARIRLGEYLPAVTGGQWSTSSTDQPIYSDDTSRYLGYGAAGAGIAGSLFGGGGNSAYQGLLDLF
tara:strand:+ start:167 stop:1024 length:858 start_codon:yes stop_codon:yes gene_type:complete